MATPPKNIRPNNAGFLIIGDTPKIEVFVVNITEDISGNKTYIFKDTGGNAIELKTTDVWSFYENTPRPTITPNNRKVHTTHPNFPGVFTKYNNPTVHSKEIGGFNNAKAASMLERGLIKKQFVNTLRKGDAGLLVLYDGPEIEVRVEKGLHFDYRGTEVLTFKDINNNNFNMPYREKWDFYTRTTSIPFVPTATPKNTRRSRKQGGGFYPSVYGGVAGATMLAPLVARQCLRMYNNTRTKRNSKHVMKPKRLTKNKSLRKKKSSKDTRANA